MAQPALTCFSCRNIYGDGFSDAIGWVMVRIRAAVGEAA
jgi:hypothetical protein